MSRGAKSTEVVKVERQEGPRDHGQAEMFPDELLQDMLNIERQRIESTDKRTETVRMFIKASDDSDKRQFDYSMAKLESDDKEQERKYRLLKTVLVWGGGALLLAVIALFYMMFFGLPEQSRIAEEAFKILFIALAGYGVGEAVVETIKKLMK